jgi:tRNA G10  N-methylase Trm11
MIILAKVKFDLRDPDELYFAQREIESLLNTKTRFIKTIASLFKKRPFNLLDDEVVHLISRLVYMGEGQGFLADLPPNNIVSIVKRATFFREIYVVFDAEDDIDLVNTLKTIGLSIKKEDLKDKKINPNLYTQIFFKDIPVQRIRLVTVRFLPFQTIFEYVTEVKKLPAAVFRPKNNENWQAYFREKEQGIEKGIQELLEHLATGYYRSPHFGLGKNHIGDFVDWASTDLRKPFLHYLHKYKGKGDPRISRALINLLKVSEGDTILDPFAGSGAFIADAPTMGINAIGFEILNIGKTIADVKCNLSIDLYNLRDTIIRLFDFIDNIHKEKINMEEILNIKTKLKAGNGSKAIENIMPHLGKIVHIKHFLDKITDAQIKAFLCILLSQQVVEFSEKKRTYDIFNTYKSYVEDRYLTLYATRKIAEILGVDFNKGKVTVIKGDSTNMTVIADASIDGILTSPPYFDALDYIGNNKPSILIFDFDEDLLWKSTAMFYESKHRDEMDSIVEQLPLMVSDKYLSIQLPRSSIDLISLLEESKRSYKSKIVENYLKMMFLSFQECYRVLKKGRYYLMVISKFHQWTINGKDEIIETAKVLADVGESAGFKLIDTIDHGLSKADKGKIGVEEILIFQK